MGLKGKKGITKNIRNVFVDPLHFGSHRRVCKTPIQQTPSAQRWNRIQIEVAAALKCEEPIPSPKPKKK